MEADTHNNKQIKCQHAFDEFSMYIPCKGMYFRTMFENEKHIRIKYGPKVKNLQ
jgi:hypothetical protein